MSYLQILKLVLSLLPLIVDAIRTLEAAIPASKQGAAKLAALRDILEAAYQLAGPEGAPFATIWPALERTVGAVVALFNVAGGFRKG